MQNFQFFDEIWNAQYKHCSARESKPLSAAFNVVTESGEIHAKRTPALRPQPDYNNSKLFTDLFTWSCPRKKLQKVIVRKEN